MNGMIWRAEECQEQLRRQRLSEEMQQAGSRKRAAASASAGTAAAPSAGEAAAPGAGEAASAGVAEAALAGSQFNRDPDPDPPSVPLLFKLTVNGSEVGGIEGGTPPDSWSPRPAVGPRVQKLELRQGLQKPRPCRLLRRLQQAYGYSLSAKRVRVHRPRSSPCERLCATCHQIHRRACKFASGTVGSLGAPSPRARRS